MIDPKELVRINQAFKREWCRPTLDEWENAQEEIRGLEYKLEWHTHKAKSDPVMALLKWPKVKQ